MSNWQQNGASVAFGVEQARELLRQVPLGGLNDRMVIDVIRKTLASAGVDIQSLMEAVAYQQDQMTTEIVRLQSEIASLNQAIEDKTVQVQMYQSQLAELGSLRDRFET